MRLSHLKILCLLFLATQGCSTISSPSTSLSKEEIMQAYLSGIEKFDGINEKEAILLAQSQLVFLGKESQYYKDNPQVLEDQETWEIQFLPITRTLGEVLSTPVIFVFIDKKNGEILWQEKRKDE